MNNLRVLLHIVAVRGSRLLSNWLGAISFYTCIPVPHRWPLEFSGIARWAPLVGVFIGVGLGVLDAGLNFLNMPILVRSALIVAVWVAVTGGLHLDGAMDTADGLAVLDPQRRLEVMADSRTGAFGAIAAAVILLLKITALASLVNDRSLALMLSAGWGRWGQLAAIAFYPYLKPTGKGAFHKTAIRSSWEVIPMVLFLAGVSWWLSGWYALTGVMIGWITVASCLTALLTGIWFYWKLGGHTGDTYGAVVEWTEALLLCGLTTVLQ